jgi:hypothetical protein
MRRHQIVAAIPDAGATPVVLFDFDDWFKVAQGTDFSPPDIRVSSTYSQLIDGEKWGASTRGDRTVKLKLSQFRGDAEEQAWVLQTLSRLLDDSRGQVFLWQDEGTVNERYFRTKRAALQIDDLLLLEDPKRVVSIDLAAEPSAYGRPVYGQFTIANNPISGTNKMSATFPADKIKGDVPAPLWLKANGSAIQWYSLLSSCCVPQGSTAGVPIFTGDFTPAAITGWTVASTADSTAVSGTRKRMTRSSGANEIVVPINTALLNVPRGDYRILARVQSSLATADVAAYVSEPAINPSPTKVWKDIPGTTWAYVDCGIVRAPGFGPRGADLSAYVGAASSRTTPVTSFKMPSTGTVDLDGILLVPAELDLGRDTITALTTSLSGSEMVVDGINREAYNTIVSGASPLLGPVPLDGGFPEVVPGATCRLNFVRRLGLADDDKTLSTVIDWMYIPEYNYIRSAEG